MKIKHNPRGFEVIEFKDHYNHPCSLSQSSLAEYQQPGSSAIWFGTDDAQPKVLATKAGSVGVKTSETTGWVDYPIPSEVLLSTHMHLNRKQVAELIPLLQKWLDSGSFTGNVKR